MADIDNRILYFRILKRTKEFEPTLLGPIQCW